MSACFSGRNRAIPRRGRRISREKRSTSGKFATLVFFEDFGAGLEGRLQHPPEEIAAVAQQERLATVDDLPLGGGIGGRLQFLGHDEGLLDDESLGRRELIEIRREHGCSIRGVRS